MTPVAAVEHHFPPAVRDPVAARRRQLGLKPVVDMRHDQFILRAQAGDMRAGRVVKAAKIAQ